MVYRGVWHPAASQMRRVFASSAAVQYHSQSASETNRLVPGDAASVLRFTWKEQRVSHQRGRAAVLERQGETIVYPLQRHL